MLRAMTILVKFLVCVICLCLWSASGEPAIAGSEPPADAPPASTSPAPTTPPSPTLPPVTFTASDSPTAKGLEESEKSGPIDLLLMQDRLAGVQSDATENAICHQINLLCTELVNSPFRTDPQWHFGLNPMIWISRTTGSTSDWWKGFRAVSDHKTLFEGFAFVYDDTPVPSTASAGYRRAVERNNTGLETLFTKGDIAQAAAILETAVSADTNYPVAAYNAGLLHLGRHNLVGAFASFLRCLDRHPSLEMKTRIDEMSLAIKKLSAMLKREDGQARRLVGESIDTSWALAQAGQYGVARRVAGQGMVVDNDEKYPECPAIVAYCYARQGDLKSANNWLITSLERSQRPGVHERIRQTLVAVQAEIQKPASPAAAPAQPPPAAPAQPPAAPPPTAPPR